MVRQSIAASAPPRRSQKQRRDDTQRRLLEATLSCLVSIGYARTTTSEIVRAAGVSQGALFKHYPTKAALMSAAVAFLFEDLVLGYRRDFAALPEGADAPDRAFELLWQIYTGERLTAAFELYLAARTDRELSEQLWPVVQKHRAALVSEARRLFPEAARNRSGFDGFVDLIMCAMGGIVVEQYGAGPIEDGALLRLKEMALMALGGKHAKEPRRERPRASTRGE